ncbi:MAG: HAD family hydrolase [Akkermansiaceae bacterium]
MDFLFDIGSVIVGVDFEPALKRISTLEGDVLAERLNETMALKDEMESGRMPADEYFQWIRERLEHTGCKEEFLNAWTDIFSPNEPMWHSIRELKNAGHRLILFSNINQPHQGFLHDKYEIFECFDGGVFSHETGYVKPEEEIYQHAIEKYNLTPEETAYVDDLAENIAGGERAGFRCHRYSMDQHAKFEQWLASLTKS